MNLMKSGKGGKKGYLFMLVCATPFISHLWHIKQTEREREGAKQRQADIPFSAFEGGAAKKDANFSPTF